jgi:hypothetical protein
VGAVSLECCGDPPLGLVSTGPDGILVFNFVASACSSDAVVREVNSLTFPVVGDVMSSEDSVELELPGTIGGNLFSLISDFSEGCKGCPKTMDAFWPSPTST